MNVVLDHDKSRKYMNFIPRILVKFCSHYLVLIFIQRGVTLYLTSRKSISSECIESYAVWEPIFDPCFRGNEAPAFAAIENSLNLGKNMIF